MATVSVVVQFFEDFDFIERVLERLGWVDEIVINDGPFTYTRELLEPLTGRDLDQPSPRAAGLFALLSRRLGVAIRYHHGAFAGEREKRIHGYELAGGDVVLSVEPPEAQPAAATVRTASATSCRRLSGVIAPYRSDLR